MSSFPMPGRRARLFVGRDRLGYAAMVELSSTLDRSDWRSTGAGIYVPLDEYLGWRDGKKAQDKSEPLSDDDLRHVYVRDSEAWKRVRATFPGEAQ